MPGFVFSANRSTITSALAREGWSELKRDIRTIVALHMECLDWDNETPIRLDPDTHITAIWQIGDEDSIDPGEILEFDSSSSALISIKAFDYPTRGSSAKELTELFGEDWPNTAHVVFVQPLQGRLLKIKRDVEDRLGVEKVEVEFHPQLKKHWVGG